MLLCQESCACSQSLISPFLLPPPCPCPYPIPPPCSLTCAECCNILRCFPFADAGLDCLRALAPFLTDIPAGMNGIITHFKFDNEKKDAGNILVAACKAQQAKEAQAGQQVQALGQQQLALAQQQQALALAQAQALALAQAQALGQAHQMLSECT